ncbi:MAG: CatB-related O-acetyltransferase [Selenomonadaceae bacterium]
MIKAAVRYYFFGWLGWIYSYLKIKNSTVKVYPGSYVYNSAVGKYNTIYQNVVVSNSSIGDFTYIAPNSEINNTEIGRFCSIGPGVYMGMGEHPTKIFVSMHPIFFSKAKQVQTTFADMNYFSGVSRIFIGNDVWVGSQAIILDGVKIGDGAIIAAGAVVNSDVPAYAVYGGVPAKFIKYRFEEDERNFLLKDKWWNKPEEWLRENYKKFHDIKKYIEYCKCTK